MEVKKLMAYSLERELPSGECVEHGERGEGAGGLNLVRAVGCQKRREVKHSDRRAKMTREKVMYEMNSIHLVKQIEDTVLLRIKRDQVSAECTGNVATLAANTIKCTKE